ncbi:MAG TPA: hypothetical protein VN673_14965 [Clostridia bacterium]|nr:hypothetical protein [Clostridia bacterium]
MKPFAFVSVVAVTLVAIANAQVGGTNADYTDWTDFCIRHERDIVSGQSVDARSATEIKGLEIDDASFDKCGRWGRNLTNVVYLRITSNLTNPLPGVVSAATNFPKLEYLHLQIRRACSIAHPVSLLTNLSNLRYLGIDAPKAALVDSSIYKLTPLTELMLRLDRANIPDGIAHLKHLKKVRLFGRRTMEFGKLPADLRMSRVEYLELMNIPNVEERLPSLPPGLLELVAVGCQIKTIPEAWLQCESLESLDLNMNHITSFPMELTKLPSLAFIGLDLNNITNVPHLKLADDRQLKITLTANPIRHFAPENEPLVQRGVIEK